jgi:hypothetical protein
MRKIKYPVLVAVVAFLALTLCWRLLLKPKDFADNTTLPHGSVEEPVALPADITSNIRIDLRLSLSGIANAANKLIPWKQSINLADPPTRGELTRSKVEIYRASVDRMGIRGKSYFQGELKKGIWTVKSATAKLDGSSVALSLDSNWDWKCSPNIVGEITEMDVAMAPDWLGVWVANRFVPDMVKGYNQMGAVPLRPLMEGVWKGADQTMTISEKPHVMVGLRPHAVVLGGPVIDEPTNDLVVNVGMDVQSWCSLDSAGSGIKLPPAPPLPPLNKTGVQPSPTQLNLPFFLNIKDLSRLFQPQTIPLGDGKVEIQSLELSDKDGMLYAKLHVAIDLPSEKRSVLFKAVKGTLMVQGKPSCDPATGELRLEGFSFTPRSDSILVNILGKGASAALKQQIELLLPPLSGGFRNRCETYLNHESEKFLVAQITQWADAVPDFAEQIRSAKPVIKNVKIIPQQVEALKGHLIIRLRANADLGLSIN